MKVIPHRNRPLERREAFAGLLTRLSSVDGIEEGQIVGKSNGEGRGVTRRAVKPKEIK